MKLPQRVTYNIIINHAPDKLQPINACLAVRLLCVICCVRRTVRIVHVPLHDDARGGGAHGTNTTAAVDRHHGRDIDGACGQLAVKVVAGAGAKATDGSGDGCGGASNANAGDIEDLFSSSSGGRSRPRGGNGTSRRKTGRREKEGCSVPRDTVDVVVEGNGAVRRRGVGWGGRVAAIGVVLGAGIVVGLAVARARRRG